MTAIAYYARLFVWLFGFRRKPESASDLHFFSIRILFRHWCTRCIVSRTGKISAAELATQLVPVVASDSSALRQRLMKWLIRSRYRLWVPYLALLPVAALAAARRTRLQSREPWSALRAWRHLVTHPLQLLTPSSSSYPVNAMVCLAAALLDLAQGESASYRVALKDDFYRTCRRLGIPHPRTYAQEDFPLAAREYIIKPTFSAQGRGLRTTADPREAEHWVKQGGWIVQDRLYPHDVLRKLSGVNTMGCFRVATVWGRDGPDVLAIQLKVPLAEILTDAFNTHSSMAVGVDASGVLGKTGRSVDGREFDCHPLTGQRFDGIRLPAVPAMIEMALKLHREVYPEVFFLGFDVALTNQGPQFLESNLYLAAPEVVHDPRSEKFIAAASSYMAQRSYKLDG